MNAFYFYQSGLIEIRIPKRVIYSSLRVQRLVVEVSFIQMQMPAQNVQSM